MLHVVALLRDRDRLHDKLDYVYGYEPGISLRAGNKVGEDSRGQIMEGLYTEEFILHK